MFGLSKLKIGLGLGALLLIGLLAFGIKAGINKIAEQGAAIQRLRTDLEAEKQARARDVAGLTTLTQGIVAASSARSLDEEVLRETIDQAHPQPVSAQLGAFLDGLRRNDRQQSPPASAVRSGPAARPGAAPPSR